MTINHKFRFMGQERQTKEWFVLQTCDSDTTQVSLAFANPCVKDTDGFLYCSCGFSILKEKETQLKGYRKCECGKDLSWDLEPKFKVEQEAKDAFRIIASLLSITPYNKGNLTQYSELQIQTALSYLTEEQLQKITGVLFLKLLSARTENLVWRTVRDTDIENLKMNLQNQENAVTELKQKIKEIEEKNQQLQNTNKEQVQAVIAEFIANSPKLDELITTTIQTKAMEFNNNMSLLITKMDQLNPDQLSFEFEKVKHTLNIMMELWEKGTDFTTVLLKAKTDFRQQLSYGATQLDLQQNCQLTNSNSGNYLSSFEDARTRLFERF